MGTEIKCKECGRTLAEFDEVPTKVIWYSHLRARALIVLQQDLRKSNRNLMPKTSPQISCA